MIITSITPAVIVIFFLLYNAIGENNKITQPLFVKWVKRIDDYLSNKIEKYSDMRMRDVKDVSRKKVVKWLPWIFGIVVILAAFKVHNLFFLTLALVLFMLVFFAQGLESFEEYLVNLRKSVKQIVGMAVMTIGAILLLYFSSATDDQIVQQIQNTHLEQWALITALVLGGLIIAGVIHFFSWVFSSLFAHIFIWSGIQLAAICKWLNPERPLRPAYLIGQITIVIVSLAFTQ